MKQLLQRTVWATSSLLIFFFATTPSGVAFSRQQDEPRSKAWLGVTIRDVTEEIAKTNKLEDVSGAYVSDVADKSPADSVGIREKDIIVEFDKKKIDDANDLVKAVAKSKVGDKVSVLLVRKGEKNALEVVLTKTPHRKSYVVENPFRHMKVMRHGSNEGMQLMELNDQLGEYFGTPGGTGVLVVKVRKGSSAEKAGAKAGDVLLRIGKRTIDDMEDVSKALSKYEDGDKADIEVLRKGSNRTLSIEVSGHVDDSSFGFFREGLGDDGMFRLPPFQEYHFDVPRMDEEDFQFEFHNPGPEMKSLERKFRDMEKSFREHRGDLIQKVRHLRFDSV